VAIRIISTLAIFACIALFPAEQAQADTSANNCVALVGYSGKAPRQAHVIRNVCDRKIGLAYCHSPSSVPGTKDSVCGQGGQYYQQRISLAPGETHSNVYSEPADSRLSWGACFDNQFYFKQTDRSSSAFRCDYPNKR
jgi:hypothetical protein